MPALARARPPWQSWVSTLHRDHALVGRIWSVREKRFLKPLELRDRLALTDFVLLGETHDNPDHHRLQAWLISAIVGYDRRPAVVMEMISLDQADKLEAYLEAEKARLKRQAERPAAPKPKKKVRPGGDGGVRIAEAERKAESGKRRGRRKARRKRVRRPPAPRGTPPSVLAAGLGPAIGWEKTGWPSWSIYQPIARAVFAHKLALAPGNPGKAAVRRVGKGGLAALPAPDRRRLVLDRPLPRLLREALTDELERGHCNLVPRSALGPMRAVQRLRDAVMADQLLKAGAETGAILIAGGGHVRADYAVPWYLTHREPDMSVASVIMIEVDGEAKAPGDLVPKAPDGYLAAHYVWFTPRTKRPDPCERLRKRFGLSKKGAGKDLGPAKAAKPAKRARPAKPAKARTRR